ncbi:hypothetical protein [Gaetbulibacter aestuarii]|uniref:Uncharacterized protein n=1 Tax=Gaetbulibacter aestuarii TaxID=1502358 RepID=A0ABW7MW58_9FLAO
MYSILKLIIHFPSSHGSKEPVARRLTNLKIYNNLKIEPIMKALKITLILVFISALFSSCTKQDLNENDILQKDQTISTYASGGIDDK